VPARVQKASVPHLIVGRSAGTSGVSERVLRLIVAGEGELFGGATIAQRTGRQHWTLPRLRGKGVALFRE
jgi:hypothetical protein